jgi:uncharacterized cupin superfamily protein
MTDSTRYPGPLSIADAKTKFVLVPLADDRFQREGPRSNVEYRDLGLSEATGGLISAKHIRAIQPFDKETGWHWHDMTAHFVYVLKGWVKFRYQGVDDEVRVAAGTPTISN